MQSCPSDEQLQLLLAEQLSATTLAALEVHVESCAPCQHRLEKLTDYSRERVVQASPDSLRTAATDPPRMDLPDPVRASIPTTFMIRPPEPGQPDAPAQTEEADRLPVVPGYKILGLLGRGGAGIVYRACDLRLNRLVALKLLQGSAGAEHVSRIRREAEASARLQHPNIVQIHEVGDLNGLPYLALELVEGPTLAACFDNGPLSPPEAAALTESLARAMHFAHQRGIVHRDLKPANILLHNLATDEHRSTQIKDAIGVHPRSSVANSLPKITDFGLAKQLDNAHGLTHSQAIMGTPSYMAPEQASGRNKDVGPAADVYALGAVLYEALTGRPPFRGATVIETLDQVCFQDPISVRRLQPSVPTDLETITHRCMQKEPQRRYASGLDLADDLRRFLDSKPIAARPPSALYLLGKFARRNKTLVLGLGATAAALVIGTLVSVLFALGEARQRHRAEESSRQAEAALQEALWQAYQGRLAAAQSAFENNLEGQAAKELDAAPPTMRRWEWSYFRHRLDESTVVTAVGTPPTLSPIFFPHSRRAAFFPNDGPAQLWDAEHGTFLKQLADCREPIVAYGVGRSLLFLGQSGSGPVRVLDESGELRTTISMPGLILGPIAAINPAGTHLALSGFYPSGAGDYLGLFDLATGKEIARLLPRDGLPHVVAISPTGSWLAAGLNDGRVELWDVANRRRVHVLQRHRREVSSVMFSLDSRRLLSSSWDGTFRQWDVATGRLLDDRRGDSLQINSAAYSPDGQWIATGGNDRVLRIWATRGGEAVTRLHGQVSYINSIAYSADGCWLASCGDDGTVRLYDTAAQGDARILRGHTSYVYLVAFSPDGSWLASAGWDNVIRLWDVASGEPIAALRGRQGHYIAALAVTPDGKRLITLGNDETLRFWDSATGKLHRSFAPVPVLAAAAVHRMAVRADGKLLAVGDHQRIRLWDLETLEERDSLPIAVNAIRIVAFSPDGTRLAVAGSGNDVWVIHVATGEVAAVLRGHTSYVQAVTFNPEGSQIVTAGRDMTVRLWDAVTGNQGHVLHGHTAEVFAAVFNPDGTRIATAGRDRIIRIWDTASGSEMIRLAGHADYVFSLAFSPDGRMLPSGSGDYTVRLWDSVSLRDRYQARRELAALQPQADALVDRLAPQGLDAAQIVARIRADESLNESLRWAAWHVILRQEAAKAK